MSIGRIVEKHTHHRGAKRERNNSKTISSRKDLKIETLCFTEAFKGSSRF